MATRKLLLRRKILSILYKSFCILGHETVEGVIISRAMPNLLIAHALLASIHPETQQKGTPNRRVSAKKIGLAGVLPTCPPK